MAKLDSGADVHEACNSSRLGCFGADPHQPGRSPELWCAAELVGLGRCAVARAAKYAKERVVFDRPIGQNQAIQHPLAANWMALEAANLMAFKAASLYDAGKACGAGIESAHDACPPRASIAVWTVKSAGTTRSRSDQSSGNDTGAPGRTRGL